MSQSFTVTLDTTNNGLEIVGGKGRSLSRLANAGFDVPGGFQITASAYRRYVAHHNLQAKILELAKPEIVEGAVSFENASSNIGRLFADKDLSAELLTDIRSAYEMLPGSPAVAVRSSANAEDLPELSFAGQQETYLNVKGGVQVSEAVKKCWGISMDSSGYQLSP